MCSAPALPPGLGSHWGCFPVSADIQEEFSSCGMWDQFPAQGSNPRPPALGMQSLSHWTTREVLEDIFNCHHQGGRGATAMCRVGARDEAEHPECSAQLSPPRPTKELSSLNFPGGASGEEPACQGRRPGDTGLIPVSGRSPGRGRSNPLQCSRLENPHGRVSLVDYSPRGCKGSDTAEAT